MNRNQLNAALAKLSTGVLTVSEFLRACTDLHDDKLDAALEGIYTGKEGRFSEAYDDRHNLVVGWCYGKIEYAYIG